MVNRRLKEMADQISQMKSAELDQLAYLLVQKSTERALRLESFIGIHDQELTDQELWEVSMRGAE